MVYLQNPSHYSIEKEKPIIANGILCNFKEKLFSCNLKSHLKIIKVRTFIAVMT